MKIAVVGAGGMGGCHLEVYKSMQDIEVAAIVDIDREKAAGKAWNPDIRIYEDIDEMLLREKIDMVDICTPTYLHASVAIRAMEKGVHVLCEKPISLNQKSAREMIAAAEKNGVFFMVAHVIRFWPQYIALKEITEKRLYGNMIHAVFSRIGEKPAWSWENWMLKEALSGRVPLDLHIHDTDYIVYLLGKPQAVRSHRIEAGDKISYIKTQYRYEDLLVEAEGAWYDAPIPFSMSFRVVFENAILVFSDNRLMLYENGKSAREIAADNMNQLATGINIQSSGGYENEIRYFIDCIRNNVPPKVVTPQDCIEIMEVLYKELESAKTDKEIEI